jgi:hypothetical protein
MELPELSVMESTLVIMGQTLMQSGMAVAMEIMHVLQVLMLLVRTAAMEILPVISQRLLLLEKVVVMGLMPAEEQDIRVGHSVLAITHA